MRKTIQILSILFAMMFITVSYNNCGKRDVAFEQGEIPGLADTVATDAPDDKSPLDENLCFNDQFQQGQGQEFDKIDVLFVSDSSGSTSQERGEIIGEINSFVSQLPPGSDYQFAVLIGHGSAGSKAGKLEQRNNEPHVLSSNTMTLVEIQNDLTSKLSTQPGETNSDGGEEGLYSLYHLMQTENLARARNQGFFRADAGLAIIFLSDENDICMPSAQSSPQEISVYEKDCLDPLVSPQSVYISALKLQGIRPLAFSGIIYTNAATVPAGGENELGYGYLQTIMLDNGAAIDLAGNDFAKGLSDIGKLVSKRLTLIRTFPLNNLENDVDRDTIVIMVDGIAVNDFNYDDATGTVTLSDPGDELSVIDINYCELN